MSRVTLDQVRRGYGEGERISETGSPMEGNVTERADPFNSANPLMGCASMRVFGITKVVRTYSSVLPALSTGRVLLFCAALCSLLLTSCGLFSSREGLKNGFYLPLTVQLRQAPTVATAQVSYYDACGQPQTLSFGKALAEAITRKSGLVFEKIVPDGAGGPAVDGYQDVSFGMATLDLAIPRKATRSYPAVLAIGLDFAYTTADGNVLFSKKLQAVGRGDVDAIESSCEVKGLNKIGRETISRVTDGMAVELGNSNRIPEAAGARKAGAAPAAGTAPPPSPIVTPVPIVVPTTPTSSATVPTGTRPDEQATLVFRAIIRDENRNQLLHQG